MHIHICICMSFPKKKKKLLHTYNVTCMFVFWANYLTMDNQLTGSFLEKATFPPSNFGQFPAALCYIGLRSCGFSPSSLAWALVP